MVRSGTANSSQQLARVAFQAGSGPTLILTPAYEVKTFCIHTTLEDALCTNGYVKTQHV